MQQGPDVLGSEREPRGPLPRWIRLATGGAVVLTAVGWLAAPQLRHRSPVPPASVQHSTEAAPVPDEFHCGPAGPDGLAWSTPQVSGIASRVAVVRVLACNTGRRATTVLSLRGVDLGRATLRPEDLTVLTGGVSAFGAETMPLPVRIPAGGQAPLGSASAVFDCTDASVPLLLRAEVHPDGGGVRTDDIPLPNGDVASVSGWCADPQTIALERMGRLDVRVDPVRRTVAVGVELLNPNDEPVHLTGVGSPSDGVRVVADTLHGRTLAAGGTLTVTARFRVERCDRVFVDGPWSLLPIASGRLAAAPVALSSRPWQQAAVGILCPERHPLMEAHRPAVVQVNPSGGGSQSGAGGKYQVDLSLSVLNAGPAPVLLSRREAPVPGAVLRSVWVAPGESSDGPGQPLTRFRLSAGASATVTLSYEAVSGQSGDCAFARVAGWRAPVAVSDPAGRPVVAAVTGGVPGGGPSWLGSWLLSNPFGCPGQQLHRGTAPPFLVREDAAPLSGGRLQLTLLGLRALPAATVLAIRPVGPSADLALLSAGLPREVPPGRAVSVPLTPQTCPAGTTDLRIAVDYRVAGRTGVPPPLVIDLPGCTF